MTTEHQASESYRRFAASLAAPTSSWRDDIDSDALQALEGPERKTARAMLHEALVFRRDRRAARALVLLDPVGGLDDLRMFVDHGDDFVAAAAGFVLFEIIPDRAISERLADVLDGDDDDARLLAALHFAQGRGVDSELAWEILSEHVGAQETSMRHQVAQGLLRHAGIEGDWCVDASRGAGLYETLLEHPHPAVADYGLQVLTGIRHALQSGQSPTTLGLDVRGQAGDPLLGDVMPLIVGRVRGDEDVLTRILATLRPESQLFAAAHMVNRILLDGQTWLIRPLASMRLAFVTPVLASVLDQAAGEPDDPDVANFVAPPLLRDSAFLVAVASTLIELAEADSDEHRIAVETIERMRQLP